MKLLLLRCPRCAHALAPGERVVVMMCPNCRSAVSIDEGGLALVDGLYAAPRNASATHWLPFWITEGRVAIAARETQGGSRSAAKDADAFWREPRRFYIPALAMELAQATELMRGLLERQPRFETVEQPVDAAFEPAVVAVEDARKLVELVVVSIEARRKDHMKRLDFALTTGQQELWLLPARKQDDDWQLQAEEIKR